ncbi:MAG: PAS domain S-box protein [Deltaproteobacteria bacterium]|nr:PAS domain S-box protein [Deltaproteobacteria bacterium]
MVKKQTYEELGKKVNELEDKILRRDRLKEELEGIYNFSDDLIGSGNLDGYFTKINSSFERILGYTEKEFLENPFIFFVKKEDVEKTKEALTTAASGKGKIFIENRYRCKDGSYKWIEWKVVSIVQENRFYAVGREITQRKRAENKLRESEERFRMIFNHSEDGMIVANPVTPQFASCWAMQKMN